jgi:hypothetical protein
MGYHRCLKKPVNQCLMLTVQVNHSAPFVPHRKRGNRGVPNDFLIRDQVSKSNGYYNQDF